MVKNGTIYYDFEYGIGINAYFPDSASVGGFYWHEWFASFYQFNLYCELEYLDCEVIEINNDNYSELCAQGVFNGIV
ncbi:hypothetical protein CS022_04595 [Veronia nyctiphanis]|uniref:Uncharacterized protein n=1 Tax=Veronia nyctiphanis TaxID=1278244 RepID=A0A4Q0YVT0_9GAMM|nr:hypothetical protein [Veronia nyctiphanis]RXJ74334.1 hypothetical protein CS022_04595 [Veronia nyctiphanis]